MSLYQPNIPTGLVALDQDYLNIQGNFQQLDISFGVDHFPFSNKTSNNGYHTVVHMVPISTTITNPPNNYPPAAPPVVPYTGELYTTQSNDGIASQEILWWQTGGGVLAQMTRNFAPVISGNGSTFLPGGLILQWGSFTAVATTATAKTFNMNFPNACYGVWANMQKTSSQTSVDTVYCYGFSGAGPVTGFTYFSTSSGTRVINWVALGN